MSFCNQAEFLSSLSGAFKANGLSGLLSKDRADVFYQLTEHMLTVNQTMNLTAITDPNKIILNHYVDCAFLAAKLPKNARILDVGCGGGFPSLPIAVLRPDVQILAIDSTEKKVNYVAATAEKFSLFHLTCRTMRAEDGGKDIALRESFDVVTARAVAELRILAELCLPFVKIGGQMIAMKGKQASYELADAKKALALLGGKLAKVEDIRLVGSGEEMTHPLIFIDKITKTPAAYPRVYAQISKKPL